jgi:uncharacterized protein (DUF302 family)
MPTPLIIAASPYDVASTVDRVQTALRARGVTLFASIDHAAGAREAGLELADEVLLVFGNPDVGTGLMQQDPSVGIELPLRLLIWDEQGTTQVAFSDPAELTSSFRLAGRVAVLSQLRTLLDQLVAEATR